MTVQVKLYAHLRQYIPNNVTLPSDNIWEVDEGITVKNILAGLGLPDGVKVIIMINGLQISDYGRELEEGDILLLYPIMSGG